MHKSIIAEDALGCRYSMGSVAAVGFRRCKGSFCIAWMRSATAEALPPSAVQVNSCCSTRRAKARSARRVYHPASLTLDSLQVKTMSRSSFALVQINALKFPRDFSRLETIVIQ